MDYEDIENLVKEAKLHNKKAKEMLAQEFTPFILNLSKKSFINSYELADIQNECYKTLFKCIEVYNLEKHRFAAYATIAIKNQINVLIRNSIKRASGDGPNAFILDDKYENILFSDLGEIDEMLFEEAYKEKLKEALKALDTSELELITYVYYKKYSLKKYAEVKGVKYAVAYTKKKKVLEKLGASLLGFKSYE